MKYRILRCQSPSYIEFSVVQRLAVPHQASIPLHTPVIFNQQSLSHVIREPAWVDAHTGSPHSLLSSDGHVIQQVMSSALHLDYYIPLIT
jgi:hypothetical protein